MWKDVCWSSLPKMWKDRTGKVHANVIVEVFLSNMAATSTINLSSSDGRNVMEAFSTVCSLRIPLNYLTRYQVSHCTMPLPMSIDIWNFFGVFLQNLAAASIINPSTVNGGNIMEAFATVCSPRVLLNYKTCCQVSHWLARGLHAALLINY